MQLIEYLEVKGLTRSAFAKIANIPETSLCNFLNGRHLFSPASALKIELATKGHVNRLEILYPIEYKDFQEVTVQCKTPMEVVEDGSSLPPLEDGPLQLVSEHDR